MKFGKKHLYDKTPKKMVKIGRAMKASALAGAGLSILPTFRVYSDIIIIFCLLGTFLVDYFGVDKDEHIH